MASTVDARRVAEFSETSEDVFEEKIDQLAAWVRESRYTVFYTGAGVSTSAGIGDYRGPSGAWTLRRIKELQRLGSGASVSEVQELQKLLDEQKKEQQKTSKSVPMSDAQPTLTHMMQATLIHCGLAQFVVTTNLDGIYRKAGLQAHEHLCFLHGDIYTERCTGCGYDFERNWHVRNAAAHVHDHSIGTCSKCGSKPPRGYTGKPKAGAPTGADCEGFVESGLVGTRDERMGTKDTHINFGECLDEKDWDEAEEHCSKADLCIVMGTSMSLRHITHFPFKAKRTVIINLQRTPDDKKCHLRIWAQCDPVAAGLLARLGLEPMPVPVWRPRDGLPLNQLPSYLPQRDRDAAKRLEELTAKRTRELFSQELAAQRARELARRSELEAQEQSVNTPVSVKVGNTHAVRDADNGHAWRLYVSGEGADQLSSVEVWLHPTFSKNHYTLDQQPFQLDCAGWGTFEIPLRLHKKAGGYVDTKWPLQFDRDDACTAITV